jgi:hypothetical protein
MFRFCILPYPLMYILVLLCCIISYPGSTSSHYIDHIPIIFDSNPLHIPIILVPLFSYLYQKCWIIFGVMVCCSIIHTCCEWKWTIFFIVSRILTVMTNYWSSTSSKSSSSATSSSIASFVTMILSVRCIILRCLIILWLCIIILWWSKLLHVIILRWHLKLLCMLLCHQFILHPICI